MTMSLQLQIQCDPIDKNIDYNYNHSHFHNSYRMKDLVHSQFPLKKKLIIFFKLIYKSVLLSW